MLPYFQNRLNITKTIRKFSIDANLKPTGAEFNSEQMSNFIKHGDEVDDETDEGSIALTTINLNKFSQQ